MAAPVTYGFVGSILEGFISRMHWSYLCPKHAHALHVGVLTLHIEYSLIHHAWHIHECTYRGCGHTMLSRSRLGYYPLLAHHLGQQYLTNGVIDLMGSRMVEVFALQIYLATVFLAHPLGEIERRWATHIVSQQIMVLGFKLF